MEVLTGTQAASTRKGNKAAAALAVIAQSSFRSSPVSGAAIVTLHRSIHVSLCIAGGQVLSAVVALAALCERELDLGAAFFEVKRQGDQREVVLRDLRSQPLDLVAVREELAGPIDCVGAEPRRVLVFLDVDEAVLLSDRIVMMSNGPAAHIGELYEVCLPRPRNRLELSGDPGYIAGRARVLEFLHRKSSYVEAA